MDFHFLFHKTGKRREREREIVASVLLYAHNTRKAIAQKHCCLLWAGWSGNCSQIVMSISNCVCMSLPNEWQHFFTSSQHVHISQVQRNQVDGAITRSSTASQSFFINNHEYSTHTSMAFKIADLSFSNS